MKLYPLSAKVITLGFIIVLAVSRSAYGQYSMIKSIQAETTDGITVSVWAERETVRFGQNITIKYKVSNGSEKTIYLVWDNTSNPVAERGEIVIREPLVALGGHEGYDYTFTKIEHRKTYQGKLIIPRERYGEARPWRINVGFGYVIDITGLNRALNQAEDPLPMKAMLNSRIKTLLLGSLRVDVIPL